MPYPYHMAREMSSTRENLAGSVRQFIIKYQMDYVHHKYYKISGRTYNRKIRVGLMEKKGFVLGQDGWIRFG